MLQPRLLRPSQAPRIVARTQVPALLRQCAEGAVPALGADDIRLLCRQYALDIAYLERPSELLIDGALPQLLKLVEQGLLLVLALPLLEPLLPVEDRNRATSRPKRDLPPTHANKLPNYNFLVRVLDDAGKTLSGIPLIIEHGSASAEKTTDGAGQARVNGSPAETARVKFKDAQTLRDQLRPVWDQPRPASAINGAAQPEPHTSIVLLHGDYLPNIDLYHNQQHTLRIEPWVERARLIGGFFDTAKCFLLPTGIAGIRGVVQLHSADPKAKLLIVGHTDTTGKPEYNDLLSLERAEAVKDYLTNNRGGWLKWYGASIPQAKRWGEEEDLLMLGTLADAQERPMNEAGITWFQRTRGLEVDSDGHADADTRDQLIKEYMALEGTALPANANLTIHGCGEYFPQAKTPDNTEDPENRRVEIFFFDEKLGIQPKPPGKNSKQGGKEYPDWVKRAKRTEDYEILGETLESNLAYEQFVGLAHSFPPEDFAVWMGLVFGAEIPLSAHQELRKQLLNGSFPRPRLELSLEQPGEHHGRYDPKTRTITIYRELVRNAETDPAAAGELLNALVHEFGHHVDHILRTVLSNIGGDAAREEGAAFASCLLNLQFGIGERSRIATYHKKKGPVELELEHAGLKSAVERWSGLRAQLAKGQAEVYEYFEAGKGHAAKPGCSYAHGSIESEALTMFSADEHELIYFGNWLRDFSQIVDPKLIRPRMDKAISKGFSRAALTQVVDVLARKEFKDKSEFHVTPDMLGVYRAEEHIDNPRGIEDGTDRDPDFRSAYTPAEGNINTRSYLKNYIATSGAWATSTGYIETQLREAVQAGPTPTGFRYFGSALHTLEDYFAHSNFSELLLRELGYLAVIPWTASCAPGIYPVVTGCFGGLDTAASLVLAIAEGMQEPLDCSELKRSPGVLISLILIGDISPQWREIAGGVVSDFEAVQRKYRWLSKALCLTVKQLSALVSAILGAFVRMAGNTIDEYQTYSAKDFKNSTDPTHTQLAKDHDDHPLHTLAAKLAVDAVNHVGKLMKSTWANPNPAQITQLVDTAKNYLVHPRFVLKNSDPRYSLRRIAQDWARQHASQIEEASSDWFWKKRTAANAGPLQERSERLALLEPKLGGIINSLDSFA